MNLMSGSPMSTPNVTVNNDADDTNIDDRDVSHSFITKYKSERATSTPISHTDDNSNESFQLNVLSGNFSFVTRKENLSINSFKEILYKLSVKEASELSLELCKTISHETFMQGLGEGEKLIKTRKHENLLIYCEVSEQSA
jgi:hypothetical protein